MLRFRLAAADAGLVVPLRVRRIVLACVCAALACSDKTSHGVDLEIRREPDLQPPAYVTLDWLQGELFLFRARRVPVSNGASVPATVAHVRITVDDETSRERRLIARAHDGAGRVVGEGTAIIQVVPGAWRPALVMLRPGLLPDGDGDKVPDEVDGCPHDPVRFSPCQRPPDAAEPDAAIIAKDADLQAPVDATADSRTDAAGPDAPNMTPTPDGSPPPIVESIAVTDFSKAPLTLNGVARVMTNAVELTWAMKDQAGSMFFDRALTTSSGMRFSLSATLQIAPGTSIVADGMTVVLQNSASGPRTLGSGAGSLGYGNITPSVAVKLDVHKNPEDATAESVAILANGMITRPLASAGQPLPVKLGGGQIFYVWLDYDGGTRVLSFFLSSSPVKPAQPLLTHGIDLAASLGTSFWVGFTAGTGGLTATHRVLAVQVENQP